MKNFVDKLWVKTDIFILVICVIMIVIGYWQKRIVTVSNFLFVVGLGYICLMICNILLHAGLFSGWFKKKKKGETDEEYQADKIEVETVASKKNRPIHFEALAANCLVLGLGMIVLAIIITL